MKDLIITGASRGIGLALARAMANTPKTRLILTARDADRLTKLAVEIEALGGQALAIPGDLSSLAGARALGERLSKTVEPGATLVQNAGLWPTRRQITADGLEAAFAINYIGPLLMQEPLLSTGLLSRVLVVSAGLIVSGRFSAKKTPIGAYFSPFRTYCTTKLCLAVASRDVAARYRDVDFVVLHPGVVQTDLGVPSGIFGSLVHWVKRSWETPEVCAARLKRILEQERWSNPGEAPWMFEEQRKPWPKSAELPSTREAVRAATRRYVKSSP